MLHTKETHTKSVSGSDLTGAETASLASANTASPAAINTTPQPNAQFESGAAFSPNLRTCANSQQHSPSFSLSDEIRTSFSPLTTLTKIAPDYHLIDIHDYKSLFQKSCELTTYDRHTMRLIEVPLLFKSMDYNISTLGKTIAQLELQARCGCYVAATECQMAISDFIAYQAPMFDALNDPDGRFGTELKITRDTLFKTTPKSLVILDELAQGTTFNESKEVSEPILKGFNSIGNNTLWLNHNYELAEKLRSDGVGQFIQVEFKNDKPTHKLIDGISRDSRAHEVAKRLGFTQKDIEEHLRNLRNRRD